MKTFIHFKTPLRCEKLLSNFCYLLWQLPPSPVSFFLAKILSKNYAWTAARRICLAGLSVLKTAINHLSVSVKEGLSNKRFMAGLWVSMVAFPLWKCHLLFDINDRIADFYYVNYAFYFNTIRAYLCGIFLSTGFFIAAPQKWAFRWWAVPVVIFCGTEIYAESFYTHWTDFYQGMPSWQVISVALFSVPALYLSIDYLAYRKYHLKDGNVARFIGVIKMPGVDADTKMNLLEKLVKESEQYNARV